MSPAATEAIRSGRTEHVEAGRARIVHDDDPFSSVHSYFPKIHQIYRKDRDAASERPYILFQGYLAIVRSDYCEVVSTVTAEPFVEDIKFEVFDSTGIDAHGVSRWVTDLAMGIGSHSHRIIESGFNQVEQERVTEDIDHRLEADWLTAAFDAVFAHAVEDVELEFDPDDYPVT
jgi:hypothetical protein